MTRKTTRVKPKAKCPNCKQEIDAVSTEAVEWWYVELFISSTGALEANYIETTHWEGFDVFHCVLCGSKLPFTTEAEVEKFLKGGKNDEE